MSSFGLRVVFFGAALLSSHAAIADCEGVYNDCRQNCVTSYNTSQAGRYLFKGYGVQSQGNLNNCLMWCKTHGEECLQTEARPAPEPEGEPAWRAKARQDQSVLDDADSSEYPDRFPYGCADPKQPMEKLVCSKRKLRYELFQLDQQLGALAKTKFSSEVSLAQNKWAKSVSDCSEEGSEADQIRCIHTAIVSRMDALEKYRE